MTVGNKNNGPDDENREKPSIFKFLINAFFGTIDNTKQVLDVVEKIISKALSCIMVIGRGSPKYGAIVIVSTLAITAITIISVYYISLISDMQHAQIKEINSPVKKLEEEQKS